MNQPVGMHKRERASRSFFDRWARTYDRKRIAPWFQYTQELAIENLELSEDSRVLDVGCGTGYGVRRIASVATAGKARGIDISPAMIEQARSNVAPEIAARTEFRVGSSSALPYSDGAFTHVLCTNSFHHYPDPLHALGEMRRVLETGGQLVILENALDLSWYAWAWDRLLRIVEKGHVRYYPSQELGELISRAGFEDVELRVLQNEFLRHGKLFASIQVWSARRGSRGLSAVA